MKRKVILIIVFSFSFNTIGNAQQLGKYFSKKEYFSRPLPVWSETKDLLPSPILDGNPDWVDMYWKCWEISFRGFNKPIPQSPFVSNWLDEAFSENIFQWDTIFMVMFARYGHSIFPAIESLDNFYSLQWDSGFIGAVIDMVWKN